METPTVWTHPIFGDANWLWINDKTRDFRDFRMQFRRTFELTETPTAAEIVITADSGYQLHVNGEYVTRGPARGFQRSWPFDRVEVGALLKPGRNVIAVQVHQLGISNFQYIHQNNGGLLVAGQIGPVNVATGLEWKLREAPGFTRAVDRLSQQTGWQEHYDARFDPFDAWKDLDYDDSAWSTADGFLGRVAGGLPWHDFEERGIPPLTSEVIAPKQVVSRSEWTSAEDHANPQNLVNLFVGEQKRWTPADESADALSLPRNGSVDAVGAVLDFGTEVVGTPIIEVEGAVDGEMVDLLCCESLTESVPDLLPKWEAGSKMSFGNRVTLAKGGVRHEFNAIWGFRYLIVIRRHGGDAGELTLRIRLRQTLYPLEETGLFSSSDETLNGIWNICRNAVRSCMLDAFVDCPWREQAQWWGDSMVISRSAFYLSADARLLARGIRLLGSQRLPGGLTPAYAPAGNPHPIVDFSLVWIVSQWSYYFETGDLSVFRASRDRVREVLDYFRTAPVMEGLLCKDPRYWLFLDWCRKLHKEGVPATLNLWWLWALKVAADLFALTEDQAISDFYRKEELRLRDRIINALYDDDDGSLADGLTWQGERVSTSSPHATALAILLDLLPNENERLARETLLPPLNGDWRPPDPSDENGFVKDLLPTPFFMYYIFEALKKTGFHHQVIDVIRRWWGEWVDMGLATTPEMWEFQVVKGSISQCHAWSGHPLAHFAEILLGVTQAEPGWKTIRFNPKTLPGERFSGVVPTPFGPIAVNVDHTGSELKKRIEPPEGVMVVD